MLINKFIKFSQVILVINHEKVNFATYLIEKWQILILSSSCLK